MCIYLKKWLQTTLYLHDPKSDSLNFALWVPHCSPGPDFNIYVSGIDQKEKKTQTHTQKQ